MIARPAGESGKIRDVHLAECVVAEGHQALEGTTARAAPVAGLVVAAPLAHRGGSPLGSGACAVTPTVRSPT